MCPISSGDVQSSSWVGKKARASELDHANAELVIYYDDQGYHEAPENITLTDVYFSGDKEGIKNYTNLKNKP